MIYANGVKIDINDIVRLTFMDGFSNNIETVAEIAVQYDCLKQIRDGITNVIEDHEAKLAKMAKAN